MIKLLVQMGSIYSKFFKHCWSIMGEEVMEVVVDFFKIGKLLKAVNVTTLTLVLRLIVLILLQISDL